MAAFRDSTRFSPRIARTRLGARATKVILAGAFAGAALALHLALGSALGRTGVLHEWDVLFSADPTVYVTSLTTGENTYLWGGRSFVHPNITNVLHPVVAPIGAVVHSLHPDLPPNIAARRVAYLVCPIASAITAALLVLTLLEFGLGPVASALLGTLYLVSFSALIFGSLPESYCLSGLGFAWLFFVAVRTVRPGIASPPGSAAWVTIGAVIAGTTITNIIPFALVAAAARRARCSLRQALVWSAAVSAAALAITVGVYALGAVLSRKAPPFNPFVAGQVLERHPFDPHIAFVEFPAALANTMMPPVPLKAPADPLLHQEMNFVVTFHGPPAIPGEWWRAALVLGLFVLALARARRLEAWQRVVVGGAALVVVFNWVLHAFYGSEMFLYSQHWELPVIVVLAALLVPGPGKRQWGPLVAAALIGVCVVNNVYVWRAILRLLSPAG